MAIFVPKNCKLDPRLCDADKILAFSSKLFSLGKILVTRLIKTF